MRQASILSSQPPLRATTGMTTIAPPIEPLTIDIMLMITPKGRVCRPAIYPSIVQIYDFLKEQACLGIYGLAQHVPQLQFQMRNYQLSKPQPSPKNGRSTISPFASHTRPKSQTPRNHQINASPKPAPLRQLPLKQNKPNFNNSLINDKLNVQRTGVGLPKSSRMDRIKTQVAQITQQAAQVKSTRNNFRPLPLQTDSFGNNRLNQEAITFISASEEALKSVEGKINELYSQRVRVKQRFLHALEEIEEERRYSLKQINLKYDKQAQNQQLNRNNELNRLCTEEERLRNVFIQIKSCSTDVSSNLPQMNVNITAQQFNEIMAVYWAKLKAIEPTKILRKDSKFKLPSQEDTSAFKTVSKDDKDDRLAPRDFTFSKKLWGIKKCKEATSYEDSGHIVESNESVVQQRYSFPRKSPIVT